MNRFLVVLAGAMILASTSLVWSEEQGKDQAAGAMMEDQGMMMDQATGMANEAAGMAEGATGTAEAMVDEAKVCLICGKSHEGAEMIDYEYDGKTYKFCSQACLDEFKKDPEMYIKKMMESKGMGMKEEAPAMKEEAPAAESK